ncbi:hypothetical protein KIL84_022928 [Mauremys mutica]|uniref:Uncharacterized protein n=1 Tax=Mauremys mutica TaxID=74926 RepID=A0A9D3WLS1_9SAUR|nr:hypothetical protein KIL84_022928 [Mauremys mutica]
MRMLAGGSSVMDIPQHTQQGWFAIRACPSTTGTGREKPGLLRQGLTVLQKVPGPAVRLLVQSRTQDEIPTPLKSMAKLSFTLRRIQNLKPRASPSAGFPPTPATLAVALPVAW